MLWASIEDFAGHVPGLVGGGAIATVVTSLVWGYILRRRENRKDREQQYEESISVAKEWQQYAARITEDFDAFRSRVQNELTSRDSAIDELKRRNDRCERRERKLRARVMFLEDRAGISPPDEEEDSDQ